MRKLCPPKSIRKFLRREKGRIRREIPDLAKQKEQIARLYEFPELKKLSERKKQQRVV